MPKCLNLVDWFRTLSEADLEIVVNGESDGWVGILSAVITGEVGESQGSPQWNVYNTVALASRSAAPARGATAADGPWVDLPHTKFTPNKAWRLDNVGLIVAYLSAAVSK